jgi:hypothetical protein
MKQIEYVASGTSHTRILATAVFENPDVIDVINSYFSDLNGKNGHQFSLLFNAFTEKDFGKKFVDHYKKSIYTIHADSGGLQIITQGKTITPELKDNVYKVQANYSDVAMCFDEIPITVVGESSDRNDTSGRIFDKDNLEQYARLTGKNIKRQIEVVLNEKSTAKPMIIAQGNCYETYMSWVEYILKEIPSSYYQHIGGIAMGAAALGTGPLEDIERAAYATQLPFQMDEPYIHILGVGSIRRLLPYLALARSGYYPKNIHLSYDSTTHTSGVSMGLYYLDGGMSITRSFSEDYITIYNDINSKYNFIGKGIDVYRFYEMINQNSSYYYLDNKRETVDKEKMLLYYHNLIGYICSSISNFTYTINKCIKSESKLLSVAHKNKVSREINSLLNMRDLNDFKEWYNVFGNSTKSKRIKDSIATLDNLF